MKYPKNYLNQKIILFIFITSVSFPLLSMDNHGKKGFPFDISPKKELKFATESVIEAKKVIEELESHPKSTRYQKLMAQKELESAQYRYTRALNNCPLAKAKVQATNSIRSFMDSLKGPAPVDPSEALRILQNREYTLIMTRKAIEEQERSGNTSKQVISRRRNELKKEEQEFARDLEDFKKQHKIVDNPGKKDFAIEQKRGASIQNQPIDESQKSSSNSYGRAIGKLAKSVGQKTALPLVAITELACKTDAAKHSVFDGFCEGFNDEKMLLADAETQNAHRDAYVRNAISVASDILLLRANPVLGATVIGSTQAKKVRSLIEEAETKEMNDRRKAQICTDADLGIDYFEQQRRDAERNHDAAGISIFHDAIENAKLTKEKFGCPEHPFCRRADLEIVFLENEKRRAEIDQDYENVSYFDGKIKYEKLKKERFGCSEFSSDDNSIAPDADSFYYAYISSLCEGAKEILKASRPIVKPILKVGEIIDEAKKEIDHQIGDGAIAGLDALGITEENFNKITSFVQEAMTYAPPYIQRSWNELIGIRDAEGATRMSLARTPKGQRAKKILDDSLVQKSSEERDEQLARQIEEYNQQIRSAIAHTISRAQLANLNVEPIEDNLLDNQEFNYPEFRKYIHGGFRGLTSIATIFGHDNTAYRLSMTGSASLELMDAMDSFLKDGLSCGIDPYLGALSAVATISLLCRKKEKDNSAQVILDAVNRGVMYLSEQIYRFEKNVLQNFVEMFKNDNRHHIIMLEKFGALHLDQENFEQNFESFSEYVKNNHEAIQNGIDALSKQANNNFRMTLDNLNGLRVEEIDDLIKLSLLKRENLSTEEFCRYVDELYVKATARASADSLTGGSIDLNFLDGVQNMLEGSTGRHNIFEHPAFSNINLLSKYIENTCENFKHEKLVNPIIWIKCVEALLYLINQKIENDIFYPSTEDGKGLDLDKLMMLKNEGEKIIKFLERIDKNQYLKKIARDYQSRLQELADAIMQEKASYEEKQNQKLCRKHRINIEHEKAKITNRLSDGDQCKKCVENITEGLKSAAKAREMRNRGDSSYLQALGRFYIKGAQNNIDIFDKALNRDLKTEDIHNPAERFKKFYAEYLRAVQEKEAHLLNSTKLDLAQNAFSPVGEGMLSWIYPHDIDLPILMLPKEKLPIDPVYIVAENKGIGYITHYYSVIDKDFHLESFFNFKEDNRSVKILHLRKPHDFRSKTYTNIENINHFWYGGRYPKEEIDTFKFPGVRPHTGLGILSEGYFPPESPYPAAKDVFVSTAHKEIDQAEEYLDEVKNCIQQNQTKNRIEFNQEVINHILSHSTSSSIFKAAQHVDVCFKMLDSLLTMMYNDLINETRHELYKQFVAIKSKEDDKCIKNFAAMSNYIQNYSQRHNPEHKQGNYLPFYIAQTTKKLTKALNAIVRSNCKPQFNHVTRVIDNIGALVAKYRMRNITPRILAPRVKNITTEEPEQSMVSYLVESNRLLIEEVNGLKKQISTMQNEFARTMDLVLAKLEAKALPKAQNINISLDEDRFEDIGDDIDSPNDSDIESEEAQLQELLNYHDQDESDYKTATKRVTQQVNAECGYHALFNALLCFNKKLLPNKLIPYFKKEIAKKRDQANDDQWLSEDELSKLTSEYKGINSITLIGDVSMYYDGTAGLERSVLEELALAQQAIELNEDYQHVFILGTMDARSNRRFAHWIAVELLIDEGKVSYSVMDSLQSSDMAQQVEQLQAILHIQEERFAIRLLENEDLEERVSDYISQLALADIFEECNRYYACEGDRTEDCPLIVNKIPEILVDSIINAAASLISEVQDISFWSTEGYIQPSIRILNALRNIRSCDGQNLVCKTNSVDSAEDDLTILELTVGQKERMEMIERSISNL